MTLNTASIGKIKSLTQDAATLGRFHDWFNTTYADRKHWDKQNYGFNLPGERNGAFSANVSFSAYAGEYGSSSVYSRISVSDSDAVVKAFVSALNKHQKLIFQTMAETLTKQAAELRAAAEKEMDAIKAMLSSIDTAEPEPTSEAA